MLISIFSFQRRLNTTHAPPQATQQFTRQSEGPGMHYRKRKPHREPYTMIPAVTMATARVGALSAAEIRVLLFALTFWRPYRTSFPLPERLVADTLGLKRATVRVRPETL